MECRWSVGQQSMRELAKAGRKGAGWGGDWAERKTALGIGVGKGGAEE